MTDDRMALLDALQKADEGNFLRALAEAVLQLLMEADVDGVIGAGRYERSGERTTWRTIGSEASTRGSANSTCGSPNCGPGATFPPSWRPARPPRRHWSP
jgi:putative transposase